jgi:hypothetical protein
MSVTLIKMLMSKTLSWKAKIELRISSRPSIEDIILRQLHASPKTIGQIQNAIGHHLKNIPNRPSMKRRLENMTDVTKMNSLYPSGQIYMNLNCSSRTKYGLINLIESDLDSDDPDSINYLTREDYFHNLKNR